MKNSDKSTASSTHVCVIGAGVGGISICKQLKVAGISFECFERRDKPGGIWIYDDSTEETSVWYSMHQNSPKGNYEFSDFPMPEHYPDFPSHWQVCEYLENYIDHFCFREHITFGVEISNVTKLGEENWQVELSNGVVKRFKAVIVANGHHNEPNLPEDVPGEFTGNVIHSKEYRRKEAYKDKNVVVVGFGNSGAQLAVDVSFAAKKTFCSVRRGVYIVPRYPLGISYDKVFFPMTKWWFVKAVPAPLSGYLYTAFYRMLIGMKLEHFGIPKPDHKVGDVLPTLSENLFNRIGDGVMEMKTSIKSFDGQKVTFADGTTEQIDAIIYATGYQTVLPFLDTETFNVVDNRVNLYQRIFHPDTPGLYFIGMFQAIAIGFLHIMEAQSELLVQYLLGKYALPSKDVMNSSISKDQKDISKKYLNTLRNNYVLNGATYVRELKKETKKGFKRTKNKGFVSPVSTQGTVSVNVISAEVEHSIV